MKKENNAGINEIALFDTKGKEIDTLKLNKNVFNGRFNEALLYQAIIMYRANQRSGNASTKTRGEVRGGGKKPWRQKGTGRARAGSIGSPLWRHGGTVFGPHPRDFRYNLPKKIKRNAFVSSLNAKLKNKQISAVEDIILNGPKTKEVAGLLKRLNLNKSVLLLVDEPERNLILASRNIKNLTLKKLADTTALDILSNDHILMTKKAIDSLNKKVEK